MGWKSFKKTGQVQADSKLASLGLLIVDDEKSIVTTLEESFRGLFRIYTATSGPDALKLFKENDIHLIVSDQRMPEMTGIELFSHIKEINPTTIRILLTGYADINAVIRGVNEGLLWKYVTKPWNAEDLKALVREGARKYYKDAGLDVPSFRILGA
ncbi:MAG: response regulator [Myxococcales bacterium]|jgi:response regulator RpfG family c-di-GMP phosphodiesterase|nr:response regulator [Myxococcales bacterium]